MTHTLQVLDHTGDTRTTWNPENQAEIDAAKATFNKLVKEKKYLAYKVTDDGNKGEQIREFDPTAGKIILSPSSSAANMPTVYVTNSPWDSWITSTSNATTTGNVIWNNWVSSGTTSISYTVNDAGRYVTAPAPTAEQRAAAMAVREERQRRWDEEARLREEQRAASTARARELLLSLLTPEQVAMFAAHDYFELVGSDGGTYRIRLGVAGNVRLLEEGEEVEHLCCHAPTSVRDDNGTFLGTLPKEDVMVGQLLMLRTDEKESVAGPTSADVDSPL